MKKSEHTRQKIIDITTSMIEQTGDIDQITIRKIAEKAGIGVGLVNHYFASKDELIEICVQSIIHQVVYQFQPPENDSSLGCADYTAMVATVIMDFLMAHPKVSRISILGDFEKPHEKDNTQGTILGLATCMSNGLPNKEHFNKAFILVSSMQSAFLKRDMLKEYYFIDFEDKKQRDPYIKNLVYSIVGEV